MEKEKRYFGQRNASKSQLIYVLLALFLGAFGVHNFYAGRWGRGLVQLLLTIATGFIGTVISSLWSVVNIFTIETDGEGHPFEMNLPAQYICGALGILKYLGEIVFWFFMLIGFLTGTNANLDWHNISGKRSQQETIEKIVTPTETIYKTTQTTTVE